MQEQIVPYAQSEGVGGDGGVGDAHPALPDGPPIVKTERLTKRIRGIYALRNVSLTVRPGEIYGLVGGQGAGKSTLAQLLVGLMHPDGGTIRLFGFAGTSHARARIGYMPEKPRYHGNFTGRDYLRFHAELSGLKGREARLVADRVADTVGLGAAFRKLIGGYSKVVRQRFGLAVALIAGGAEPPELLVLDEPATGMGDELAATIRDVVFDCNVRGSTILICSRELTAVERTCTSVGILRSGRLLVQTHIDERPRAHLVGLARDGAAEILPHLTDYLGSLDPAVLVKGGASEGEHLHVILPSGPDVPHAVAMKAAALRAMVDARWDILSVYSENRDLESLFMQAIPPGAGKPSLVKPPSDSTHEMPAELPANDTISVAKSPDTGPLTVSVAESIPSLDESLLAPGKSPDTGPLVFLDDAQQFESARSPVTGPLSLLEPNGGLVHGMVHGSTNGVEIGTPSNLSGPSTSPLPALELEGALNGHEPVATPLPVRSVSGARRGAGVSSVESEGGERGNYGE